MFIDSLDIANRTCQHLGVTRIRTPSDDTVQNAEISFAYDKLRRAELMRNYWVFAIKRAVLRPIDTTTFLLAPALWNAGTVYLPGSVVKDPNGQLWISNSANNIGNDPNLTDVWDDYYGSMTVDAFDTTGQTSYFAGDLVYIQNTDSSYVIYLSLQNDNTEVPNVPDIWNATSTYSQDQTVSYNGQQWRSMIALNTNNIPASAPGNWVGAQVYNATQRVTGTDGFIYVSVGNNNLNNNPVSDDGTNWTNIDVPNAWAAVPIIPASSNIWVPLYASLVSFNFVYPIGVGPLRQELTRNIFRLPAGHLRRAPQDPKAGIWSYLGGPAYNNINDWEEENGFILSSCATPIIYRFVADIQCVRKMDDMFCEGLAARIGIETCERITNSTQKQQTCNNAYNKFMGEARIVNAVEFGPIEPPEDLYVTCRL